MITFIFLKDKEIFTGLDGSLNMAKTMFCSHECLAVTIESNTAVLDLNQKK
jgi:hypothetical protein